MTKQDRQIWEAVKKRQEVRNANNFRNGVNESSEFNDVEYCLEIIENLNHEIKRLEKKR